MNVAETGADIFQARCFVCHGRNGEGDGPSAVGLGVKLPNFTDPNWQVSVTDPQIISAIKEGGKAVGLSTAMPPNPDLSGDKIEQLVRYIRKMKR